MKKAFSLLAMSLCIAAFAQEDGGKTTVTGETKYIMDCKGNKIGTQDDVPGCTDWIWWDADNLREMPVREPVNAAAQQGQRRYTFGLGKYKGETVAKGFEGGIMLIGDLFGDWREEIVTVVNGELRVYTTTIPAVDRKTTLMQDNLYRNYIYNRSMGYTQSPMMSFNF